MIVIEEMVLGRKIPISAGERTEILRKTINIIENSGSIALPKVMIVSNQRIPKR